MGDAVYGKASPINSVYCLISEIICNSTESVIVLHYILLDSQHQFLADKFYQCSGTVERFMQVFCGFSPIFVTPRKYLPECLRLTLPIGEILELKGQGHDIRMG